MSVSSFETELRKHGQHATKPRQAVFSVLSSQQPLSMKELVNACKTIDRSSVYRTVDLFESLGFVRRIQRGWKYELELTDVFTEHHHHLHCLSCGRTVDIHDHKALTDSINQLAQHSGFTPTNHELEISGYCAECAARK